MSILELPTCPICGTGYSLSRTTLQQDNRIRVGYECWRCRSILVWLGDDLWLHGDRWAYQHIGLEDKQDLLYRPMTAGELRDLAGSVPPAGTDGAWRAEPARPVEPDIIDVEARPLDDAPRDRESVVEMPRPVYHPRPARAEPRPIRAEPRPIRTGRQEEVNALVPLAQALPDGLTLALVQYEGSQPVPVAVFEEGELRAVPGRRRRSRGSPLLLFSVAFTLLCLFCSASVLLASWVLDESGLSLSPAVVLPLANSQEPPAATETPLPPPTALPTDTPEPPATPVPPPTAIPPVQVQGVTDSVAGTGEHIIVGEVLNSSASHVHFVQIQARFFDGEGNLVDSSSNQAALDVVEAGGRAPFKLITQAPPPFASYELGVDFVMTEQAPVRLAVERHRAFVGDGGAYHVAGTAWNPGDVIVASPRLVATYYNEANQVVAVEVVPCEATTLHPGLGCRFELVLQNPPSDLSHYKLQTEGDRQ